MIGVGVIGCGLIGNKRASALGTNAKLIGCADIDVQRAKSLAKKNVKVFENWRDLLVMPEIDMIIIATLHDSLAEITLEVANQGKHVFVEKPAARCAAELEQLISNLKDKNIKIHVGFNHRYHKAMLKAKEIIDSKALGELMFIRARYGHGGRLGYEKEWRANPELSGGGELKDQGPHLIDLSRWFLGEEFENIAGSAHTYYWNMPVDDNGFMILKTATNKTAFLHVSCTEWKNLFSMEIYGHRGKIDINGLGGSYGVERLTWYRMLPEMGPPETICWEYPMVDDSWAVELAEFCDDIKKDRKPSCDLSDAFETLKIVDKIYEGSNYDHCP